MNSAKESIEIGEDHEFNSLPKLMHRLSSKFRLSHKIIYDLPTGKFFPLKLHLFLFSLSMSKDTIKIREGKRTLEQQKL